jgi:HK97 family phage portal protein
MLDVLNFEKHDKVERITLGKRTWLQRAIKALTSMTFPRAITWSFDNSHTSRDGTINYRELAGDGRNNAIIFSAIDLLSTTFAQSPIVVKKIEGDQENIVPNHDMVSSINKGNDFYSGQLLWKATMIDYIFGNAYWLKVRSAAGMPIQYYWVPSSLISPAWPEDNSKVFISHYNYNPNGQIEKVAVQDVVHFRNGLDPRNVRKGLSPLGAMLREVATDEEAAEFTHTILRNLGVTGMVISPSNEKGRLSQAEADRIKASVMMRTSGDRRGEPLVVGGAIKVDQMATDVTKLDLAAIRHIPEERLTAIIGTPAILLGLGTGLENATYSNVDGLRRIFYENKIIPLQNFIASDLLTQLLVDFETDVTTYQVGFDNSNVRVLKEDETLAVERLIKELEVGGLTINEYRAERQREPYPEDMYMLNSRIIPVAVADIVKKATVQDEPQPTTGVSGANNDGGNNTGSGNTAGKSRVETKDIGDTIERVRVRMQQQCANDVLVYLEAQKLSVIGQIRDQKQAKVRINWPRVQEDVEALKGVLEPWYKRALVAVHDVVMDVLDTRYELSGTDERTYLKSAGLNIKGINEYTRQAVAEAVQTSVALDETTDELLERIRTLPTFSQTRAALIARTELAQATNLAQIESYKASDVVVGVRITDGDQDAVCAAINGTKVRISEVRSIPPLGHPNCIRRFNHILDSSEMESSEAA